MSQAVKSKRRPRLGKAAFAAVGAAALTVGLTGSANAAVLNPINIDKVWQKAPTQEMFQPLFDYDSDSCFPAAAVESNGRLNGGLQDTGSITGGCRNNHLGKANTYSRAKCDKGSGWCGIIYTLYFEKDQNAAGNIVGGHRHEWESAVVWYHGNDQWPSYVSVSAHGNYTTKRFNDVEREGKRFKVVYHKDGGLTHSFRFAKAGERAEAWGNGGWDRPALAPYDILWSRYKSAYDALEESSWGNANFPLQDKFDHFRKDLNEAKPSGIQFNAWSR